MAVFAGHITGSLCRYGGSLCRLTGSLCLSFSAPGGLWGRGIGERGPLDRDVPALMLARPPADQSARLETIEDVSGLPLAESRARRDGLEGRPTGQMLVVHVGSDHDEDDPRRTLQAAVTDGVDAVLGFHSTSEQ